MHVPGSFMQVSIKSNTFSFGMRNVCRVSTAKMDEKGSGPSCSFPDTSGSAPLCTRAASGLSQAKGTWSLMFKLRQAQGSESVVRLG